MNLGEPGPHAAGQDEAMGRAAHALYRSAAQPVTAGAHRIPGLARPLTSLPHAAPYATSTRRPSSPRITKFGLRSGSAARRRVGACSRRAVIEAASSMRARGAPMQ